MNQPMAQPTTSEANSYVTVVFEAEFRLLDIQARSMRLFVPVDEIVEIVVIDNSRHGMTKRRRLRLLAEYGVHRNRVRIYRPDQICAVPATLGWRSQQVLKLAVARLLVSDRYVVLDAKNHFVARPDRSFFVAPDGRDRVNAYSYREHPLRPDLERVLRYVELSPEQFIDRFTATVTPFVLRSATVRELMSGMEKRSGRPFADEFVAEGLIEFVLYSAWILAQGETLDTFFDIHQKFCANVWPRGATTEKVAAAIEQAKTGGAPLFSVHRRAMAKMDRHALDLIIAFWVELGLFDDRSAAHRFVADFRRAFFLAESLRKFREIRAQGIRRLIGPLAVAAGRRRAPSNHRDAR